MPYHLIAEPHFIRATLAGIVTAREFQAMARDLEALELADPGITRRLTDLTEVADLSLSAEDMRDFVARRKATHSTIHVRSAIVAPAEVHVGYARMFQILNDQPELTIALFRTVDEAEAWLRS